MLNLAITGNVAAGKSSVVRWWREWGATVIDADVLAREAEAPGTATLQAIARRFGADVLLADGSLDRAALRGKVMGDPVALASLNAIVHPVVRRRRAELIEQARARGDRIVVNDIPLLFEVMQPEDFDVVVLVDAPVELRRRRLIDTRGLGAEDADRLIASQMPAELKRPRSHFVIDNAGDLAALEHQAREVWHRVLERASAGARP